MKVNKTLRCKVTNHSQIFNETMVVYNDALAYLINVINEEFAFLKGLTTKEVVNAVEKLTHKTKVNPLPKYDDFDEKFYKFPSYLRRQAISTAFGKVQSFDSNYQNWIKEKAIVLAKGKKFGKKAPQLQFKHKEFPVLYKGNMFNQLSENTAQVKVFHKNDWVWINIQFKTHDEYKRNVWGWKKHNPKLVQVGKKYFLNFSYSTSVKLSNKKVEGQKVCAVDLGLTNSAVCSIIDANGTILDRLFINQSKEKDRLYHMTNKLRKAQRASGYIKAPNFWRQINGYQKHIVNNTSHKIVDFAKKHACDVIVFEHLGNMSIPKRFYGAKKLRFKLQYWSKQAIQNKVTEMAHYEGMRMNRINPRNTSKLAFDGSGEVKRSPRKDLCTFPTGKEYHADLSASYNIGARYFLNQYIKTTPEKKWLSLQAKVPALAKRTFWTLSTLISLKTVLMQPKVA